MPTIGDVLYLSSRRLLDAGIDTGSLEASLLLGRATGKDRLGLINHTAQELDEAQVADFESMMARRMKREPLQYILGETEFMGLPFTVNPDVLIPRGDTEILVEAILDLEEERGSTAISIADVGTGSGAIAVVLAKSLPYVNVLATDVSRDALVVARGNAARHEVEGQVTFREGDGLAALDGPVYYLISNPPYIAQSDLAGLDPEVRDYEPVLALSPGEDPLKWHRTFIQDGAAYVSPGGYLAMEVGFGQADAVAAMFRAMPEWDAPKVHLDIARIERVVLARRKAD